MSGLINTAVFQSDFGFSVGSLRATTLVTTLPTQFVDGMQRCCFLSDQVLDDYNPKRFLMQISL